MRHSYFGKKLSRTKNERRILFRNLVREIIDHGSITTTSVKAHAVQPLVEKLITKAKKQTEQSRREIFSVVTDKALVRKLMDDAVLRFASRNSGYTRLIKLGNRRGDGAIKVMLSFVDEKPVSGEIVSKPTKTQKQSPVKRLESIPADKKDTKKKIKVTK